MFWLARKCWVFVAACFYCGTRSVPLPTPAWGVGMLILSFIQAFHMSQALESQRHITAVGPVLRELLVSALIGGFAWSATIIWMGEYLSDEVDVCADYDHGDHNGCYGGRDGSRSRVLSGVALLFVDTGCLLAGMDR